MTTSGLRLHDVFISHAREDKERFVDALDVASWWHLLVRCREPESRAGVGRCHRRCAGRRPGSLEERAASAVRLASSGPPVLVVLDNVESWTSDSEPRPLPSGSHVTVLVTTRHKWLGGSSFQHHTLEVLGLEAARALLGSVAGRVLEREDGSEELLAYLDGHALASAQTRNNSCAGFI
jgi:hypothetical protein